MSQNRNVSCRPATLLNDLFLSITFQHFIVSNRAELNILTFRKEKLASFRKARKTNLLLSKGNLLLGYCTWMMHYKRISGCCPRASLIAIEPPTLQFAATCWACLNAVYVVKKLSIYRYCPNITFFYCHYTHRNSIVQILLCMSNGASPFCA